VTATPLWTSTLTPGKVNPALIWGPIGGIAGAAAVGGIVAGGIASSRNKKGTSFFTTTPAYPIENYTAPLAAKAAVPAPKEEAAKDDSSSSLGGSWLWIALATCCIAGIILGAIMLCSRKRKRRAVDPMFYPEAYPQPMYSQPTYSPYMPAQQPVMYQPVGLY